MGGATLKKPGLRCLLKRAKFNGFRLSSRGEFSDDWRIMKLPATFRRVFLCATVFFTPVAMAAPPAKPAPKAPAKPPVKAPAKPPGQAEILKKYDLDHSKSLNVTEARTIQDAFAANPQDPLLKKFDTDKNGKISDAEVMKIIPPPPTPAKPKAAPKKPKKPQKKK